jgi:DNA-binding MarR family transcriptional regulator
MTLSFSLREAMRVARRLAPQIRASQLDYLLTVALHPGLTMTELATECDVDLATISRAVDVLGTTGRRDGLSGALGLIDARFNDGDHRIRQVFLTPAGEAFVSDFTSAIATAHSA